MGDSVLCEKSGGIARIILNRPEKRNSLSDELTAELVMALNDANRDPDVKVAVLTGSGDSFCAGGDIGVFRELTTKTAPVVHQEGIESTELFRMGSRMRKPLIASVNGHALGGGIWSGSHVSSGHRLRPGKNGHD